MQLENILSLVKQINGCTFATLDAVTKPQPGVRCEITGERVILFTNKKSSGYDNMVRRRLEEAGKNPDSFVLSDLPWGERVPDTPIITHNGKYYLQTIVLAPGKYRYFIGDSEMTAEQLGIRNTIPNQGLAADEAVYVHTYLLENITRIALMKEVVVANRRNTLRLKI